MRITTGLNVVQATETNKMLSKKEHVTNSYLKIEENLLVMRCMIDNLRLIATSNEIEQVVGSAVFGIVLTMDKQLEEIETNI